MNYRRQSKPQLTDTRCMCGCGERMLTFETLYGIYKVGHQARLMLKDVTVSNRLKKVAPESPTRYILRRQYKGSYTDVGAIIELSIFGEYFLIGQSIYDSKTYTRDEIENNSAWERI